MCCRVVVQTHIVAVSILIPSYKTINKVLYVSSNGHLFNIAILCCRSFDRMNFAWMSVTGLEEGEQLLEVIADSRSAALSIPCPNPTVAADVSRAQATVTMRGRLEELERGSVFALRVNCVSAQSGLWVDFTRRLHRMQSCSLFLTVVSR